MRHLARQQGLGRRAEPAPPGARVVASVTVGGRAIPLKMRQSRRARHLSLRIDPAEDAVELVLPRGVALSEGLRFAEEKSGWILTRLALRPPAVPFAPGAVIPYRGSALRSASASRLSQSERRRERKASSPETQTRPSSHHTPLRASGRCSTTCALPR